MADPDDPGWTAIASRQADCVIVVAHAEVDDPEAVSEAEAAVYAASRGEGGVSLTLCDLVLLHSPSVLLPHDTRRWTDCRQRLHQHHHVSLDGAKFSVWVHVRSG